MKFSSFCFPVFPFSRLLAFTLVATLLIAQSVFAQIVEIPDPNLENAIREALELDPGVPLTRQRMSELERFQVLHAEIKDLTGLEYATNLDFLVLGSHEIQDITPLETLINLKFLILNDNPITDITPLANLTNLTYINLVGVPLPNLTPFASLTQLRELHIHHCQITDITPLANLTNLVRLSLNHNQITDITPLATLTNLEILWLEGNPIVDYSPLEGLSLTELRRDEICDFPRLPIEPRLENRSLPSIVQGWGNTILNWPHLSLHEKIPFHDLFWQSPNFQLTDQGYQIIRYIDELAADRDAYLAENPNMLFLVEIRVENAHIHLQYSEDFPYWFRDENGELVSASAIIGDTYFLDFRMPEMQDIIVQQAVAVSKCGVYDGIMIDSWLEDGGLLPVRTFEQESEALINILQRIRANVDDDFLILVNSNHRKLPLSAPYINGNFMETFRDRDDGYTEEFAGIIEENLIWLEANLQEPQINIVRGQGLPDQPFDSPDNQRWMRFFTTMSLTLSDRDDGYTEEFAGIIEENLIWLEANLQEPQINIVRGQGLPDQPFDSPDNQRWMRFFTTMSLTLSDGYSLYVTGAREQYQFHYWYPFLDADLGQPISPINQRYQEIPSLYIREFTNGWAVYNRSGQTQAISLPEPAVGVASNKKDEIHLIPNLDGEIYLRWKNPADVNGDGGVNVLDLVTVANGFGTTSPDVNNDGIVNILDLVFVAQLFSE